MITALSREYGAPLTDEDLFTQKPPLLSFSSDYAPPDVSREKKTGCSSLDDYNEKYVQWKKEVADKKSFERNHIRVSCYVKEASLIAVSLHILINTPLF